MEKSLFATQKFLNFYNENCYSVSKKNGRWFFKKTYLGNLDSVEFYFKFLDIFLTSFPFLEINSVYVPYYQSIFNKDDDLNRFNKDQHISFNSWKSKTLNKFSKGMPSDEFPRSYNASFDIRLKITSNDAKMKYLYNESFITFMVDVGNNESDVSFDFIIRGEPFYESPWGKEYPFFNLPKEIVLNNRIFLEESFQKFKALSNLDIESFSFEWGNHPIWKINELGFID